VEEAPSRILYEVEAILCAATGAVLALSFFSYSPESPATNQVGPIGYWLANILVQAFGYAAYLFPALLAGGAVALFVNLKGMSSPVRAVGAVALLIVSAVALGLYRPDVEPEFAGGWVGGFLATLMQDAMGRTGSTVVLAALGMLVWLMITATPLSQVLGKVGVWAGALGTRLAERLGESVRGLPSLFASLRERVGAMLERRRAVRNEEAPAKAARKSRATKAKVEDEPVVFGDDPVTVEDDRAAPILQITRAERKPPASKKSGSEKDEQEEFSFAVDHDYKLPPVRLLGKSDDATDYADEKTLVSQSKVLEQKLATFNISGRVVAVRPGPVITTFEFEPDAGIKVSRVVNLSDDLTMALRAHSVRIVAPIPGKNVVGIEVSNRKRAIVGLRDLIDAEEYRDAPGALTLALGRDTTGVSSYADLSKMPHLLMAGATGTGKSVALNAMILSILYKATPYDVRFIMVDPKMLELALYEGIPHLLVPVVTDVKKAAAALANVMREMERRFELMKDLKVRSIDDYNQRVAEEFGEEEEYEEYEEEEYELEDGEEEYEEEGEEEYEAADDEEDEEEYETADGVEGEEEYETADGEEDEEGYEAAEGEEDEEEYEAAGEEEYEDEDDEEYALGAGEDEEEGFEHEHLPRIVVVVDELADLMMVVGREVEQSITRLAQKARAAGIHLILATQRPSVDVITGLIKANFPARVSFKVTARPDSRTILDSIGAERLLGNGDMLYMAPATSYLTRLHGAYVTDREAGAVVKFLKKQGDPEYMMDLLEAPAEEGAAGDEEFFDELYDKAVDLVLEHGQGSTSWVQRKLGVGYNRAARIMEHMESEGVVGPADGSRPRKVLAGPHASM
jgi:S-DNA-T family DNA segregation ATPase FtsK/SpoIIIE